MAGKAKKPSRSKKTAKAQLSSLEEAVLRMRAGEAQDLDEPLQRKTDNELLHRQLLEMELRALRHVGLIDEEELAEDQ